ncbi:MAG: transposase [Bacteroidota bacterium]|nr:transposase [Bacteroidota bacterium]
MPHTKVMLHYVWSTKNWKPLISKELRPKLLAHIADNAKTKGIYIHSLNCVEDHIHLLISLGKEQTISNIAFLIKGESSFWVNKQNLIVEKFEWQTEYFAVSVSESGIENSATDSGFPFG